MKDLYSREIDYLRLSLTPRCNFKCFYCDSGSCESLMRNELSLKEAEVIVRAAAEIGCSKVRITGGEPLMRRDIMEMCRMVKSVLQIKTLGITTNGFYLASAVEELKASGVDLVNISLDTVDRDVFRRVTGRDALDKVLSGIERAVQAGFTAVKINAVLLRGINDDRKAVTGLAALTERYPVDLRFIELMPAAVTGENYLRSFVSRSAVFEALPHLEKDDSGRDGKGVAEMYRLPGAPGRIGVISPMSSCFCHRCSRIRVLSDGSVRPCLLKNHEYSVKGLSFEDTVRVLREAIRHKPRDYKDGSGTSGNAGRMKRIGG